MKFCHVEHLPLYKIKYKSAISKNSSDEWFVCEQCFGKPDFFGASDEIESITPLNDYLKFIFEINDLSHMTGVVTTKLKQILVN